MEASTPSNASSPDILPIVGVVGLGYVGLPVAVAFAESGCGVIGVDVYARRIDRLRKDDSYIEDVPSSALRSQADRMHVTTRYSELARADAVLLCVPTPLTPNREPELTPLVEATRALAGVRAGQRAVLESTT